MKEFTREDMHSIGGKYKHVKAAETLLGFNDSTELARNLNKRRRVMMLGVRHDAACK